jgi:type IV secretory pathway VirB4 component
MNALCYREALRGTQVIMMEPMGHSKRLVDLIGPDGASYNPLSLRQMQLNPLDPISDDINEQKAFQISLYRLMLKQIDPNRNLTMQEAGLLDAALSKVYDGIEDPLGTPADRLPVLEQLTYYLKQLGAKTLGQELELNYVSGSLGSVYNQPTNLDVGLEADCVTYDFRDIPKSAWPLIYTLVLGRIQRVIRVRGRDRRRVIAIDEFGWLSQEPMLAETVAMWFKTFRTFGCGIWLAEQELTRLIGGGRAGGDLSGHAFIGNSTFQLFFHHESAAAEQVVNTYPNVQPYKGVIETFGRPQETGVAEAILRIPDGAYHTYMLLAPAEQRLIGS